MLTVRAAATLLQRANDRDGLAALAAVCGMPATPLSLDAAVRKSLALSTALIDVSVARGEGGLRAALVVTQDADVRDVASSVARALSRTSPHLFWLLLLADRAKREVALVAWDSARRPPRVVALHVECGRVVDSDAETLCALAAVHDEVDLSRHARWLEILGREALSRRFYGLLEHVVGAMAASATTAAPLAVRRELALLDLSRLLFLAFLQAKGWLDGDRDFLARLFHGAMQRDARYHARVLRPLFFGTLNTPPSKRAPAARAFGRVPFLNGGLFAHTPLERRWKDVHFTNEAFGLVHDDLLSRYRFTAREESTTWSEAAVDPEMLGRAFESLMAGNTRKNSGAFYTPQRVVDSLSTDALLIALEGTLPRDELRAALEGQPIARAPHGAVDAVLALRVLDPACGSGAFLVHVLERLATMRASLGEAGSIADLRRAVLVRSVFGVDLNPTAVWLCELRLWLSVVIESDITDPRAVTPLPNLDRNVRVGDALAGAPLGETPAAEGRAVRRLRERYVRATGARKRTVLAALEREERQLAIRALERELLRASTQRKDRLAELRARDLWGAKRVASARDQAYMADLRARARSARASIESLRTGAALPFSFTSHFADAAAEGGFGLVIGNPPWVRLHRIPASQRAALKRRYVVYRESAWKAGADAASAGTGFGGQVDLASLFVERALQLTRPGGAFALLVPAKLFRTLAAGGVRHLLAERATIRSLEDFTDGAAMFDAAVYPAALVATRDPRSRPARVTVHRRPQARTWCAHPGALPFDPTPGSPFLLVPPDVRRAFDAVRDAGTPMGASVIGRPTLGVKCGCNEAFLISNEDANDLPARPVLRGESLGVWRVDALPESIVWTHDDHGVPLERLDAATRAHLLPFRRRLDARADLHAGTPWWTLFRVEAASTRQHRVVWADLARAPRAVFLPRGDPTVPLNSCYVAACNDEVDALAFCALLNSRLAAAWLAILAEPARGGYRRYLGWTMSLFPVPRAWQDARLELAMLTRRALGGNPPPADEILAVATAAFGIRDTDVAPLLDWTADVQPAR